MNKIILMLVLLVCVVGLILLLLYKRDNTIYEGFGLFIKDIIIPKSCYDYLVTDGNKYYLLDSRKLYDGVNNPREFATLSAAHKYMDENKCPRLDLTDLVVRKNKDDPQESLERICAKRVAPKLFNENVCSDYAIPWDSNMDKLGDDALKIGVWSSVASKLGITDFNKKKFEEIAKSVQRDINTMTGAEIFAFVRANRHKLNDRNNVSANIDKSITKSLSGANLSELSVDERLELYDKIRDDRDNGDKSEYINYDIETCMMDLASQNFNGIQGINDAKFKAQFEKYFNNLNNNIPDEYLTLSA